MVRDKRATVVAASPPTDSTQDREGTSWAWSESLHIGSHAGLLRSWQPDTDLATTPLGAPPATDAIIVPTNRSASQLRNAVELAVQLDCHLVVIYTDRCPDDLAPILQGLPSDRVTAIGLNRDYRHGLLDFLTARHPQGVSPAHLDISRKRNVGLLLARLCQWSRVLFVDDDIYGIDPRQVAVATTALRKYAVAGFKVTDYPDNSVVCHAYRLAGGNQDTFIGGNALMVDPVRANSFFPPMYNEDWLFLAPYVEAAGAAVVGAARQLSYAPFKDPSRASSEEFGDVFAEGTYRLIHEGAGFHNGGISFWRDMLRQREQLLDEIATRLVSADSGQDIEPALLALAAAAKRLLDLSPIDFVSFARAWRTDMARWQDDLDALPDLGSIARAADHLNLTGMIGPIDDRREARRRRPDSQNRFHGTHRLRLPPYARWPSRGQQREN